MSPTLKRVLWSAVQIGSFVAMLRLFFILAPWTGAMLVTEASPDIVAVLPAGCSAFTVNHGQYHCFEYGTLPQNPIGFVGWLSAFLACMVVLSFTRKAKLGLWSRSVSNGKSEP